MVIYKEGPRIDLLLRIGKKVIGMTRYYRKDSVLPKKIARPIVPKNGFKL